jgi:hypothetical protein
MSNLYPAEAAPDTQGIAVQGGYYYQVQPMYPVYQQFGPAYEYEAYQQYPSYDFSGGAIPRAEYYSIDVECVATGLTHNSRAVAQVALVVCVHSQT